MRYHALACDYDGTIAHYGRVDGPTMAALERVRASGRKLLLVSGRELEDLKGVFPQLDRFDLAVLENGAMIYDPATKAIRTLGDPPHEGLVRALEQRGVRPLSVGRVIVATWEPHETAVLEAIRDLGLELQVIFNKGAVMVLPSGINKSVGMRAALASLSLSPHNVVGIGDAENDHAFLSVCEFAVATANAVPQIKERADWVTAGDHGVGVSELIEELLADDLRERSAGLVRHQLELGAREDGERVTLPVHASPVLIAGTSGAGKSTLASSLLEQHAEREYQFCIIDPEGDYGELADVSLLGDAKHAPASSDVIEMLLKPGQNVVVNLLGIPLADRPAYFQALLPRIFELRVATGRPHVLLIDEAHHLLPKTLDVSGMALPSEMHGLLLLTVHPESVAPALLRTVGTVVAIGATPSDTLAAFAGAVDEPPPRIGAEPLATGEGWVWRRDAGDAPVEVVLRQPHLERRRHVRKYATGDLGPDLSFYFRGPDEKLKLRAQNLQTFVQLALGVDDETWTFHLRRGDYSRWFSDRIKDAELAAEVAAVERDLRLDPSESRAQIQAAIEQRYTGSQ